MEYSLCLYPRALVSIFTGWIPKSEIAGQRLHAFYILTAAAKLSLRKVVPIYVPKKCINLPFPAPSPNRMLLIFWFLSIQWLKKEISFQLVLTRIWRSFAMFLGYILGSMHCLLRSFSQSFTKLLILTCWFIVLPLWA